MNFPGMLGRELQIGHSLIVYQHLPRLRLMRVHETIFILPIGCYLEDIDTTSHDS